MSTTTDRRVITEPGVYGDLSDEAYHADPVPAGSLSSSGAKALLPPSCPATYAYEREHPVYKAEYDLGHAAHLMVLGTGPELWVVDADNWQTKKAREDRDTARADGQVPLLAADYDTVQAMALALRQHPEAGSLFDPFGAAEQSMFWVDDETGVWCRGRVDWLGEDIVDYKTTTDVSLEHIRWEIAKRHYHQQADWYLTGAAKLGAVGPDVRFRFIFQAKTAPYLVTVVDLDDEALQIGHERNQLALEIYLDCTTAGVWPAHTSGIETVSLPRSVVRQHMEGAY